MHCAFHNNTIFQLVTEQCDMLGHRRFSHQAMVEKDFNDDRIQINDQVGYNYENAKS